MQIIDEEVRVVLKQLLHGGGLFILRLELGKDEAGNQKGHYDGPQENDTASW